MEGEHIDGPYVVYIMDYLFVVFEHIIFLVRWVKGQNILWLSGPLPDVKIFDVFGLRDPRITWRGSKSQ